MEAFVVEAKMHYPVMTEKQLAARWKISVKTLHRWRADKVGPVWHKLFRYVRYHESDILDFERQSAQHWMSFLGRDESAPIVLTPMASGADADDQHAEAEEGSPYVTAKGVGNITNLPLYLFADCAERNRKQIPYMSLVGNIRFSLEEILRWELANSVSGVAPDVPAPASDSAAIADEPKAPDRVPRWYELARAIN